MATSSGASLEAGDSENGIFSQSLGLQESRSAVALHATAIILGIVMIILASVPSLGLPPYGVGLLGGFGGLFVLGSLISWCCYKKIANPANVHNKQPVQKSEQSFLTAANIENFFNELNRQVQPRLVIMPSSPQIKVAIQITTRSPFSSNSKTYTTIISRGVEPERDELMKQDIGSIINALAGKYKGLNSTQNLVEIQASLGIVIELAPSNFTVNIFEMKSSDPKFAQKIKQVSNQAALSEAWSATKLSADIVKLEDNKFTKDGFHFDSYKDIFDPSSESGD